MCSCSEGRRLSDKKICAIHLVDWSTTIAFKCFVLTFFLFIYCRLELPESKFFEKRSTFVIVREWKGRKGRNGERERGGRERKRERERERERERLRDMEEETWNYYSICVIELMFVNITYRKNYRIISSDVQPVNIALLDRRDYGSKKKMLRDWYTSNSKHRITR